VHIHEAEPQMGLHHHVNPLTAELLDAAFASEGQDEGSASW